MTKIIAIIASSLLLLISPLLGVLVTGGALAPYMTFPPLTQYVDHAPFSWIAFGLTALIIAISVAPLGLRVVRARPEPQSTSRWGSFPWWGWLGLGLGAASWLLAWTRFPWFAAAQTYTFTPLWLAYVLIVNALTYWRTGHCSLTDRTRFALALFPVSALFWWSFEYLNRFVQNWSYVGIDHFGPFEYVCYATLPFSTVLPAMLGTSELLSSLPRLSAGLNHYFSLSIQASRPLNLLVLGVSMAGLVGISIWPNYCFPLVWVSPVLILSTVEALLGMPTIFSPLQYGDWRRLWQWALAALVCGGFWEMWNMYSQAKWVYSVPFVNRFHVFEMPLLGYGGYVPFGLACLAVVALLERPARIAPVGAAIRRRT